MRLPFIHNNNKQTKISGKTILPHQPSTVPNNYKYCNLPNKNRSQLVEDPYILTRKILTSKYIIHYIVESITTKLCDKITN